MKRNTEIQLISLEVNTEEKREREGGGGREALNVKHTVFP
jgi:hypothetical protein